MEADNQIPSVSSITGDQAQREADGQAPLIGVAKEDHTQAASTKKEGMEQLQAEGGCSIEGTSSTRPSGETMLTVAEGTENNQRAEG